MPFRRADHTGPHEFRPRVRAVLGPTNTGKTHLAIERLLAHASGIIGFPLRLLARENYDRMVALKGDRHVALITGEEKIVPPEARWFSCTVEAMPLDRECEFVAVDEIQLCADPDRGHVFTDRLLHARGLVETMVLGAETILPLLEHLVPDVVVETRPRLSALAGTGHAKLSKLPSRSAIVAFSAGEVYAIAEAVRRRRGGCAVVMGRLSPRTRNAQVALYQEGEVDFLVATDAIGMGLNMDVNHVAFAGLSKFDGRAPRRLDAAEIAQIAGRAGRGMRNGTFGTTGLCPPLPDGVVEAVEQHRFDPLTNAAWRNSHLDMSHPDALLASLLAPPPMPGLVRGDEASDLETLGILARDETVRAHATTRAETRLLWDACQIPDFRKLADDTHARLCARVYLHVSEEGHLPADWIESQLDGLARADGDIDTLMARLSGVRVWSFIASRRDWTQGSDAFAVRARAVEHLLSDALHERLTARFVDRRAALLTRRLAEGGGDKLLSAVTATGDVVVEGHVVGTTRGFVFTPDPLLAGDGLKLAERAAHRALHEDTPRRVATLVRSPDLLFAIDEAAQTVTWRGETVARIRRGRSLLEPEIEAVSTEFLDGAARERIRGRAVAIVAAAVALHFQPLEEAAARADKDPALRGLLHRLREAGGLMPGATAGEVDAAKRGTLRALGVRAGRFALFVPLLVKPRAAAFRAMLLAVHEGRETPSLPAAGLVSTPAPEDPALRRALVGSGWVPAGPVMLRIDTAERIAGELDHATRRAPRALPTGFASRLGLRADVLVPVLSGLGFVVTPPEPLADGVYGPPPPPMVRSRERGRARGPHPKRPPRRDGTPSRHRTGAETADPERNGAERKRADATGAEAGTRAGRQGNQNPGRPPPRRGRPPSPAPAQTTKSAPVVPHPDSPFAVLAKLRGVLR